MKESLTDIRLMPLVYSDSNRIPLANQVRLFFVIIIINSIIAKTITKISKSLISITSFPAVDWRHAPPGKEATTTYRFAGQAQLYLNIYYVLLKGKSEPKSPLIPLTFLFFSVIMQMGFMGVFQYETN